MGNCGAGKDYDKSKQKRAKSNYQTRAEAYHMKEPEAKKPVGKNQAQMIAGSSNQSFNPVMFDHVIANEGNVEQEYKLLSPPLGQGAFGEVRKAIHKSSGLERAVKIIYKDKSDPAELAKIKDEVSI